MSSLRTDKDGQPRFFELGDWLKRDELFAIEDAGHMERVEDPIPISVPSVGDCRLKKDHFVVARYTGEQRPPKRGEWYLSGADIVAYRAPNDLSTPFHIAELVVIERKTETKIHTTLKGVIS